MGPFGLTSGVYQIDPSNGYAITAIGNPRFVDGVSVSPDGTKAYAEFNGYIKAYSITTPTPNSPIATYSSDIAHSPDGSGVISGGALNGQIVVSNNDGSIGLINPTNDTYTEIANGIGRGDIVGSDANNGTLLISGIPSVIRLGLTGAQIGAVDAPEPASMNSSGCRPVRPWRHPPPPAQAGLIRKWGRDMTECEIIPFPRPYRPPPVEMTAIDQQRHLVRRIEAITPELRTPGHPLARASA